MSDRHMFGNRKYLLLVIPLLLLLGWFMFAPGSDQKKDRTSTTNTSQKTPDHKDQDKDQKPDTSAGQVDATSTTTPSPTATTYKSKPKPRITTASATVNKPSPAPSQAQPADNQQEPPATGPVCVAYENQTIRLTAGSTTNECYILTRTDAKVACWIPYTYRVVTAEGVSTVTKEDVSIEGKPIIIIENANAFVFDDPATFVCPVHDTHMQFRVHAPENVQPNEQPGAAYDYQLQVDSTDRPKDPANEPNGGDQADEIPDVHTNITVDITEDDTADTPEVSTMPESPVDNPDEQLPVAA